MRRVRITCRNSDGSLSNEPPVPSEPGSTFPFVRGKSLRVDVIDHDGTLTPVPNVKSVSIQCAGRTHPVLATIEVYAEVDVEALDDSDPLKVATLRANRLEADSKSNVETLELLGKENAELRARVEVLEARPVHIGSQINQMTVSSNEEPSKAARVSVDTTNDADEWRRAGELVESILNK